MATLFEWFFCLRADTIEKLEQFFEFPTSLYPSVKLTVDDSPYQVNYLDVLITKDESTKTLRASLKGGFATWIGVLESWLVNRGNIAEGVRREIQRVNSIDWQTLLRKGRKIQKDSVTLVLTFHPPLYTICDILKSAHRIIENSPTIKATLPKPPL